MNIAPLQDALVVGELSLNGGLRGVRGALPIAITARANKIRKLILPEINAREAAVDDGVRYPMRCMMDVVHMLNTGNGVQPLKVDTHALLDTASSRLTPRRRGQETATRAIEVAARGQPQPLMSGPPRFRQDHGGQTHADYPASFNLRRSSGNDEGSQPCRCARSNQRTWRHAAVRLASSHDL